MKEQFHFFTYGRRKAPYGWYQKNYTGMQRLYLILGGDGWYKVHGRKHSFVKDHFYIFPQNVPFEAGQNEADPIDHMYFDFCAASPLKSENVEEMPLDADPVSHKIALSLLALMKEEKCDNALVEELFACLFRRCCDVLSLECISDQRIEQVLKYIHENYSSNITNTQLADLVHLEENHFIRVFRDGMGITPYKYVLHYRLNMAAEMIASGLPIGDTAQMCGFADASAMGHAMKREMQISPSDLKIT